MPVPSYKPYGISDMRTNLERILGANTESTLSNEIAELRKDIAALRAELVPVPSLILTGKQALDEFKRLTA